MSHEPTTPDSISPGLAVAASAEHGAEGVATCEDAQTRPVSLDKTTAAAAENVAGKSSQPAKSPHRPQVDLSDWRGISQRQQLSAWLTSAIVHAVAIVALALWIEKQADRSLRVDLTVTASDKLDPAADDFVLDSATMPALQPGAGDKDDRASISQLSTLSDSPLDPPELASPGVTSPAPAAPAADSLSGLLRAGRDANWGQPLPAGGGGLGGRTPGMRGKLTSQRGGSSESEIAVERGLKWLLAHQRDDGGWQFAFEDAPCYNLCRNPGIHGSTTAATGLALLPFLGAGYTHTSGPYTRQVAEGLAYLQSRMLSTVHGGDLQEGTMYAQGIAALALCEAYGLTKDESLRPYAEQAIRFILYAQDPKGGGWRYTPGQPGDTTVTGWQLMALKSAQMAGLDIPTPSFFLADKFLDSVQTAGGANYGYRRPAQRPGTTAVGLLCRMYLGWGRQHPGIRNGAADLDKLGPSPTDLYYDYYATQVLHHYEGPLWERWNKKMRDYLVSTQATQGHENGSWYFDDQHSAVGGRLYTTALCILTLEVYYRYLPIYTTRAIDEGF